MKRFYFLLILFIFISFFNFGESDDQEEIDFLLFFPNSGNQFVDNYKAMGQLDDLAKYLLSRDLVPGQVIVYGYSAIAENEIDSMALSRERANFVINELQKRGVSRVLFADPVGFGEVALWGSNISEEDKIPNRRVRILVDDIILTPEIVKVVEPEIIIIEEEVIVYVDSKEGSSCTFPWKILIPLLLLALLILLFLLLKRKKRSKEKEVEEIVIAEPIIVPLVVQPVEVDEPEETVEIIEIVEPVETILIQPEVPEEPEEIVEPAEEVEEVEAPVLTSVIVANLDDEIRFRAYELHLARGGGEQDMDGDWFMAVVQITADYADKGYEIYLEGESWWARKTVKQ